MKKCKKAETKAYQKEEKLWRDIYMTYNDDNPNHCDNAFHNNRLSGISSKEFHEHNKEFLKEVLEHGVTVEEILKLTPHAKQHLIEISA